MLLTSPLPATSPAEKLTLAAVAAGLLALLLALTDADAARRQTWFYLALGLVSAGTLAWSWVKFGRHPAGVQQNNLWLRASTGRGAVAWVTGLVLTGFYVVLYWYSGDDGKGTVAIGVTDDLTSRFAAGELIKLATAALGGQGGGGRPDMAQGGGPDGSKAADAIAAVRGAL